MKIMARSPLNPPSTPVLWLTLHRRVCAQCGRCVRLTLFSPSTALSNGIAAAFAGKPPGSGQCCVRCTRELRR